MGSTSVRPAWKDACEAIAAPGAPVAASASPPVQSLPAIMPEISADKPAKAPTVGLPPLPGSGKEKPARSSDQPSAVAQMVADYWKKEEEEKRRRGSKGGEPNVSTQAAIGGAGG